MTANSVRFVDTTFRDGSQSLWAMGMRGGMMEAVAPPELGKLFWTLQADIGALNRVQLTSNTADQIERMFPTLVPFFQGIGLKVACALSFSISPRHTDEHYAEKTRALLPLKPDVIYLKDQGGLLTVDRLRTIIPAIAKNSGDVPIELHS